MHKYRSADDCSQRLRHSVIIHEGKPVYITKIKSSSVVFGTDLITREDLEFKLKADSVAPPRLGYVNYNGRSYFFCRKPIRKVRQGVCTDNLYSCDGDVAGALITTSEFGKMLINAYPSVKECVDSVLKGEASAKAFSRLFAVKGVSRDRKTIGLFYAGNRIGRVDVETYLSTVDEGFECLKEMLNAST